MNRFYLLLFLAFHCLSVLAVDEPRVIRQSDLLVKRIRQMHVNPRPVDDAFGKSVNDLLIENLDPYHFIFTAEDIAEFERLSAGIDNDILDKKLAYLKAVAGRFEERSTQFLTWSEQFLQKPSAFSKSTISEHLLDKQPSQTTQNQRWKELVMLQIIERVLDYVPENSTAFPKDSLTRWDEKARKETGDYYKDVLSEYRNSQLIEDYYLMAIAMAFDPHTLYFSPSDKSQFEQELSSERELYGFSFGESPEGKLVITNVVPGSPAWMSDQVHEGDRIMRVALKGKPVFMVEDHQQGYSRLREYLNDTETRQVTLYLVNEKGEEVRVDLVKAAIYSDGDVIKNAVLKGTHHLGYISLPDFYVNWTDPNGLGCANDVAKCLLKLMKENISGLILDLRGNGGGSLKEAVDISGLFIDYGPILAVKEKGGEVEVLRDLNRGSVYNGPLIVLVDGGSASASEIVAGVLQDYRKAVIVGEQTFGKATSQSIFPLNPLGDSNFSAYLSEEGSTDGYANITNGQLYRVTGNWNQVKGVTPDIALPFRYERASAVRESNLSNVLIPDSIAKKMTYTAAPELPLEQLRTASQARVNSDEQLKNYRELMLEVGNLYRADTLLYFSPEEQWVSVQKWEQFRKQLEEVEKQQQPGYTAVSNQFDEAIYRSADWLMEYNRRFLEELQQDVELIEAVHIMNDMIEFKK